MLLTYLAVAFCLSLKVYAGGNAHANRAIWPRAGTAALSTARPTSTQASTQDKAKCAEISRLTELSALAANSTKLAELQQKANLTAAQVQQIKGAAANATAKLTQLKSNTTLANECATLAAARKLRAQCRELAALTQIAQVGANATALQQLQAQRNLTAAEMQVIKDEIAAATAKLRQLQANSTLAPACAKLNAAAKGNRTGASTTATAAPSAARPKPMNTHFRREMSSAAGLSYLANGAFAGVMVVLAALLTV